MQNLAKFVCKKMSILLIVVMVGVFPGVGHAADSLVINPGLSEPCTAANSISSGTCAESYYIRCTKNSTCYEHCKTCSNGKVLVSASSIAGECGVQICGNKTVACNPLTECGTKPVAAWSHYKTGYQSITSYICNASTDCEWVKGETEYRCAAGYYGTASCSFSSCSDCTECPLQDGLRGTVGAGNGNDIEDCYIAAETIFQDASGNKYKSPNKCMYTK